MFNLKKEDLLGCRILILLMDFTYSRFLGSVMITKGYKPVSSLFKGSFDGQQFSIAHDIILFHWCQFSAIKVISYQISYSYLSLGYHCTNITLICAHLYQEL